MKISFFGTKKSLSNPFGVVLEECLTKDEAAKIRNLDIDKLLIINREERVKIFLPLIGSKADWFNERFEKEFVLKNKKTGLLNWAQQIEMQDKFRREIVRKISELEKVLSPEEEEVFINELADLAIGIGVTKEEEETIIALSKKADEARLKMQSGGSAEECQKAQNALDIYVDELKNVATK